MTAISDQPVTTAGLLDEAALVDRILAHVEDGTTDLADETWREPVENYTSPARLDAELRMMRRYPIPFCPSAAVAEPGQYVARNAAGIPIVVVRGQDGVARAFRNSCRHRGTPVASGNGCARSLVCPYHAWTYGLDGSLQYVPGEEGFPRLDKSTRGLVEVQAAEHRGLVFVTQDTPALPGADLEGLPEMIGPDQAFVTVREYVVEANWKTFLEGFLEGYHIRAVHPKTFLPFGYDNLNVVEPFGSRNQRVTFPFKRVEKQRDVPPAARRIRGDATIVYHLFPNVLVGHFSNHTRVFVSEPLAPDRMLAISYRVTSGGSDEEAKARAVKDFTFVDDGEAEDQAIADSIPAGFRSGANETIEFGRFEGAITYFHRHLHDLIG